MKFYLLPEVNFRDQKWEWLIGKKIKDRDHILDFHMGENSAVVNKSIDSPYIHARWKEKRYTHRISREALEILKYSNSLNRGARFNLGNLENNRVQYKQSKRKNRGPFRKL